MVKKTSDGMLGPEPKAVMETAVFKSGNSYAVRLPRALYAGGEAPVYVRKLPDGSLLIEPKRKRGWPANFFDSFGTLPDDFEAPARPKRSAADDAAVSRLFRDDE